MNRSPRFWASCALLAVFAACAANPRYAPADRAPTREEVARHNAVSPRNLQIVCDNLYDTGSHIRRRACWLRQDLHLPRNQRDRIFAAGAPAGSRMQAAAADLSGRIPRPEDISDP